MSSVRNWAAPKKALVRRTEELGVFAERLGAIFFGPDWTPAKKAPSSKFEVATPAAANAFVRQQILNGIVTGQVCLQTKVSTDAFAARPDTVSEDEAGGIRARRRAAADDSENDDITDSRFWRFREGYWNEAANIDWQQSSIAVTGDDLICEREKKLLSKLFVVPETLSAYIRVIDPDKLIRSLISYDELPDADWFKRYKEYADLATRELVAAAWRYLAVTEAGQGTSNADIKRAMANYATDHGLGTSDESMKELARKIACQLKAKDYRTLVFVNSVRTPAQKPK